MLRGARDGSRTRQRNVPDTDRCANTPDYRIAEIDRFSHLIVRGEQWRENRDIGTKGKARGPRYATAATQGARKPGTRSPPYSGAFTVLVYLLQALSTTIAVSSGVPMLPSRTILLAHAPRERIARRSHSVNRPRRPSDREYRPCFPLTHSERESAHEEHSNEPNGP